MSISTGKSQAASVAANGVAFGAFDDAPDVVLRHPARRVEVELSASGRRSERRQLGSLAERRGMRMDVLQPPGDGARASIAVPRARTQSEAEAAVAIRRAMSWGIA